MCGGAIKGVSERGYVGFIHCQRANTTIIYFQKVGFGDKAENKPALFDEDTCALNYMCQYLIKPSETPCQFERKQPFAKKDSNYDQISSLSL